MERFDLSEAGPAELERRWALEGPDISACRLRFRTLFDAVCTGRFTLNLIGRRSLVWNEFYPFGESSQPDFRSELTGKGLATLAQTRALLRILPLLDRPEEVFIRHVSPTGDRLRMLTRMGNRRGATEGMPLAEYLENGLQACRAAGFMRT